MSYKHFHDCQRNACGSHQNIPSQNFVIMDISCEFEISTYNTLCSRGPTKLLAESRKNACGGSNLVLQNEAQNNPRQDFMVMNVSCKFEKSTYNTLVSRVMGKSLHIAAAYLCVIHSIHWMLSGGYNSLENSQKIIKKDSSLIQKGIYLWHVHICKISERSVE